jgi:hypothetical protein
MMRFSALPDPTWRLGYSIAAILAASNALQDLPAAPHIVKRNQQPRVALA